ncbi:hypothetical protein WS73_03365 [Burkholderia savannae]|nr:hypothetical protein WS73_03365 [Burkholderia savannae]
MTMRQSGLRGCFVDRKCFGARSEGQMARASSRSRLDRRSSISDRRSDGLVLRDRIAVPDDHPRERHCVDESASRAVAALGASRSRAAK